jgi:hypothetical protein
MDGRREKELDLQQQDVPSVSAVLLVGRQRDRAAGALASLLGQDGIERCEVMVFDADPDAVSPPQQARRDLHALPRGRCHGGGGAPPPPRSGPGLAVRSSSRE